MGIVLEEKLKDIAVYFFAALSGIFLYISLASLFPVLQDMIDDQVIIGKIVLAVPFTVRTMKMMIL